MWSMCSIETGQACTQAPQVTASPRIMQVTALGAASASLPPGGARPFREELVGAAP